MKKLSNFLVGFVTVLAAMIHSPAAMAAGNYGGAVSASHILKSATTVTLAAGVASSPIVVIPGQKVTVQITSASGGTSSNCELIAKGSIDGTSFQTLATTSNASILNDWTFDTRGYSQVTLTLTGNNGTATSLTANVSPYSPPVNSVGRRIFVVGGNNWDSGGSFSNGGGAISSAVGKLNRNVLVSHTDPMVFFSNATRWGNYNAGETVVGGSGSILVRAKLTGINTPDNPDPATFIALQPEGEIKSIPFPGYAYKRGDLMGIWDYVKLGGWNQTLTITATGGNFTLSFTLTDTDGKPTVFTTGTISLPTSAGAIQTAIQAQLGGECAVTGSGPYTIRLYGGNLNYDVSLAVAGGSPTGGSVTPSIVTVYWPCHPTAPSVGLWNPEYALASGTLTDYAQATTTTWSNGASALVPLGVVGTVPPNSKDICYAVIGDSIFTDVQGIAANYPDYPVNMGFIASSMATAYGGNGERVTCLNLASASQDSTDVFSASSGTSLSNVAYKFSTTFNLRSQMLPYTDAVVWGLTYNTGNNFTNNFSQSVALARLESDDFAIADYCRSMKKRLVIPTTHEGWTNNGAGGNDGTGVWVPNRRTMGESIANQWTNVFGAQRTWLLAGNVPGAQIIDPWAPWIDLVTGLPKSQTPIGPFTVTNPGSTNTTTVFSVANNSASPGILGEIFPRANASFTTGWDWAGYAIYFDPATTTTALRATTADRAIVNGGSASQLTTMTALPAIPAAGDIFYLLPECVYDGTHPTPLFMRWFKQWYKAANWFWFDPNTQP